MKDLDIYVKQVQLIRKEVQKVIFGKDEVINKILMTIIGGRHILIDDILGVSKTTVTVQPTRLTTASNIGYILAGAVPVGSAIRASLNKKVIVKMTKFFRHITMPFPLKTCLYGLNGD